MTLDAATTQLLTQMAENGAKPLHEMTPLEARGLTAMLGDMCGAGPDMARVEDATVPGPDAAVPVRILVPQGRPRGVLVWYHGGGWVIGALDESETLGRTLAQRTGCAVVLVDYRLAPEYPYPAAPQDAWAALVWVAEHVGDIAGSRVPIMVGGDSAGGNLAAVVSRRARDAGAPAVGLQLLVYPVTDCEVDTASYADPANQLLLTRAGMIWFWDHYAPDRASRHHPDASPSRLTDVAGLPPAVVLVAEHDVLRDEVEAYATRLRDAGVPVRQQLFAGQMHGFFTMVNVLPGSAAGIDYAVDAIVEHLTGVAV